MPRWQLLAMVVAGAMAAGPARAQSSPWRGGDTDEATLTAIANDPSVKLQGSASRTAVRAMLVGAAHHLETKSYDQALANLLEAYAALPSPRILLHIAATLRTMGRIPDAADSYQRYLRSPVPSDDVVRIAELNALLAELDAQVTVLTIRVPSTGGQVSIDGGPFIPVSGALMTRVRPGVHLVRIRSRDTTHELSVTGFEGERKVVAVDGVPAATSNAVTEGWLIAGTQYTVGPGARRRTRSGFSGAEIAASVPADPHASSPTHQANPGDSPALSSGLIAVARIDGERRGFAAGFGLAVSRGRLGLEAMVVRAQATGGYLGARYRLTTGTVRWYAAAGVPAFVFDEDAMAGTTSRKLAVGARLATGIELWFHDQLGVHCDIGYEHFFKVSDSVFDGRAIDANLIVPTIGVVGTL
ncbi:MAG: tetratricopeptide repeat protein [Kofleriaceae bacterium]